MIVVTKFDPGDTVRVGPHEGRVSRLIVGAAGMTYVISYWSADGASVEYVAYDWELTLVERLPAGPEEL